MNQAYEETSVLETAASLKRVAICGGGVAGLTLANCLLRNGHRNFVIFAKHGPQEGHCSSSTRKDITSNQMDYALTIQQADNVLRFLGLANQLKDKCELSKMSCHSLSDGMKCLSYNHHSKGNYTVPRKHLIQDLTNAIPLQHFRWGVDVRGVVHSGKKAALDAVVCCGHKSDDGQHSSYPLEEPDLLFDLVVATDGIRSKIRDGIFKAHGLPSPVVETQTSLSLSLIQGNHPLVTTDTAFQLLSNNKNSNGVPRTRVFIKPYDANRAMLQVVAHNKTDTTALLPKQLQDLIVPGTTTTKDHLLYLQPFDPPTAAYEEYRVLFLGDALHGMTPYIGQGANLAMLNAKTLADLIIAGEENSFYEQVCDSSKRLMEGSLAMYEKLHYNANPILSETRGEEQTIVCQYSPLTTLTPFDWSLLGKEHKPASYTRNRDNKLTRMYLSGLALTDIPTCVYQCFGIRVLSLKDNAISSLSSRVGRLQHLQELHLRNNLLVTLPDTLWTLQQLKTLRLSYNRLVDLPDGINKLTALTELCLSGNQLSSLPPLDLPRLKNLYASYNQLQNCPDVRRLPKLQVLRVQWNAFDEIDCCGTLPLTLRVLRYDSSVQLVHADAHSFRRDIYYGKGPSVPCTKVAAGIRDDCQQGPQVLCEVQNKALLSALLKRSHTFLLRINAPAAVKCPTFWSGLDERWRFDLALRLVVYHYKEVCHSLSIRRRIRETLLQYFQLEIVDTLCAHAAPRTVLPEDDVLLERIVSRRIKLNQPSEESLMAHCGHPEVDPEQGRGHLGWKTCMYKDCEFVGESGDELRQHLVMHNAFTANYHQSHEELSIEDLDLVQECQRGVCPSPLCKYEGDLHQHLRQLGILPYWKPGMPPPIQRLEPPTYGLNLDPSEYTIYACDECLICYEAPANVLFSTCKHLILCSTCVRYNPRYTCPLCRQPSRYIIPMR